MFPITGKLPKPVDMFLTNRQNVDMFLEPILRTGSGRWISSRLLAGTVKIFAQISLSEPAKTMINYSGKRDGAGNFLARGLRWAVGVVALP